MFRKAANAKSWILPGYLPLAMPRSNVHLLDIFTRSKNQFYPESRFKDAFRHDEQAKAPNGEKARYAEDATFTSVVSTRLNLSLTEATGFLAGYGAAVALKGQNAKSDVLRYTMRGARSKFVRLDKLQGWLYSADTRDVGGRVSESLIRGRCYVASGVLLASGLDICLERAKHSSADLEVTVASSQVTSTTDAEGRRVFSVRSTQDLIVGAQLINVRYVNDRLTLDGVPIHSAGFEIMSARGCSNMALAEELDQIVIHD